MPARKKYTGNLVRPTTVPALRQEQSEAKNRFSSPTVQKKPEMRHRSPLAQTTALKSVLTKTNSRSPKAYTGTSLLSQAARPASPSRRSAIDQALQLASHDLAQNRRKAFMMVRDAVGTDIYEYSRSNLPEKQTRLRKLLSCLVEHICDVNETAAIEAIAALKAICSSDKLLRYIT